MQPRCPHSPSHSAPRTPPRPQGASRLELTTGNIFDPKALARNLAGCAAAINLVGILNPPGTQASFRRVHVELVAALIAGCREAGVPRLLHMSALNADPERGPSAYLRSKGEGEYLAHGAAPDIAVTSFRPR